MEALLATHSGIRYLVLLAGVVAVAVHLAAWLGKGGEGRAGRVATAVFAALIDLQIVIGLTLFFAGDRPPGIVAHLAPIVAAAAVVHATSIVHRRRPRPLLPLVATLVALAGIAVGILAIRESIF